MSLLYDSVLYVDFPPWAPVRCIIRLDAREGLAIIRCNLIAEVIRGFSDGGVQARTLAGLNSVGIREERKERCILCVGGPLTRYVIISY